jgi:hypothetical protein
LTTSRFVTALSPLGKQIKPALTVDAPLIAEAVQ